MLSMISIVLVVILGFLAQTPDAFVICPLSTTRISSTSSSSSSSLFSSTKDGETEVEKLLRMAKELRQQAEQDEQEIHNVLIAKKEQKDSETDALIATLFDNGNTPIVNKLSERKCCTETLLKVVDRLFERECKAKGLEQVVVSSHNNDQSSTQFKRVKAQVNQADLDVTTKMMDDLVDACAQLDAKFLQDQEASGKVHVTHLDREHWNAGALADLVDDHIRGLRREHDEQFQKRQQEFFEAQRRKDLPPSGGGDGEFMNRKLR